MAFDPSTFKMPGAQPQPDQPQQQGGGFNPQTFKFPGAAPAAAEAVIPPPPKMSATKAALTGMMASLSDTATGIAQAALRTPMARMGTSLADSSGNLPDQLNQRVGDVKHATDEAYYAAKAEHPVAAMGGYAGGVIGQGMALPGGQATKFWGKVGEGALTGSNIGGVQYNEGNDAGVATANQILGGMVGAGVAGTVGAAKGVSNYLSPKHTVVSGIGDDLSRTNADTVAKTMAASKRTGIHLTPGEATGSQALANREGAVTMNPATQQLVERTVDSRQAATLANAKKVIDSVVPEGKSTLSKAVDNLYKKVENVTIKDKVGLESLKEYPIYGKISNKIVSELGPKAPKPGTVGYLDTVKKYLDDEISSAIKSGKSASGGEVGALQSLKSKIVGLGDAASPEYSLARKGAQRLIVQNKIQQKLDKVLNSQGEATPKQINKAFFGSLKKTEELISELESVGVDKKAIQQVTDLATVLNKIDSGNYKDLLKRSTDYVSQYEVTQGGAGLAKIQLFKRLFGRRDAAIVDLISNPNWADELSKMANSKNNEAIFSRLSETVGRISAARAAATSEE